MNGRNRSDIKAGTRVQVVQKQDQRTAKLREVWHSGIGDPSPEKSFLSANKEMNKLKNFLSCSMRG